MSKLSSLALLWYKYSAVAVISMRTRLAYPIEKAGEAVFLFLMLSFLFFLYRTTLAQTATGISNGLGLAQIMWIILWTNIFSLQHQRGLSQAINDEILSGQIAYRLNRPYSYLLFHYADFVGEKIISVLISGPIGLLFIYYFTGFPPITLIGFTAGLIMLCSGAAILFLLQLIIGLCAFWIEDVSPLRWIYKQAQGIAGGAIIPIALFPTKLKVVISVLPFAQVAYGAAKLMVSFTTDDFWYYIALQTAWLLALILLARFLFKRGLHNVAINGG